VTPVPFSLNGPGNVDRAGVSSRFEAGLMVEKTCRLSVILEMLEKDNFIISQVLEKSNKM
jgi:hypothetical protein